MNRFRKVLLVLVFMCANCLSAFGQFTHPGIAHSKESIKFVTTKIAAKEKLWLTAWKSLKNSRYSSTDWKPTPFKHVERGPYNNPNVGSSEFSSDARAAYYHALCWALSGEEAHAKKAAQIVNAWSGTLESIGNHDARLLIGMSGYHFCIAAELLKHTWDKWSEEDQSQFKAMIKNVWYPVIKDFYPSANGNWDGSMLQVMIAMGVFLDDQEMFDRARNYYLNGKGNGAICNYFMDSGQCQESGRDQAHTQMGLEFLANTCETAWIQGVDLYGAFGNRLLKGFEYTAKYNLGLDVTYVPYKSFEGRYHYKRISSDSRGRLRAMYERVYNHFHNRKGLDATYTQQAAIKLRPNQQQRSGKSDRHEGRRRGGRRQVPSFVDTLMYANQGDQGDQEGEHATSKRTDRKPNVIVILTDDQGYGDVSALNPKAKFKTPNLDRLAREGIAFTRGHSADSVCTPSRYSLLTGRYPWRTTLKRGVMGSEAKCLIPDDRMTLASLFKENGYHTAMVGKWHLGMDFPGTREDRDWTKPVKDMPLDKGFDYFFGIPASLNFGVLAWFEGRYAKIPPTLYTKKKKNPRHLDYRIMPPYNLSEGLEVAPDFIDNQCLTRFTDKAVEWIEGKVDDAKSGKPFFLYLPYTSPHYPVCPLPKFHGRGDAGAYGEFVIETDFHVGRILKTLESSGIDENTLVVFTSDNGPEKSWSVRIKDFDHDSRGALRGGKRSVYEGGHRVPFLVRWPAGIQRPGRFWNKSVGQIDLLATFAELIDVKLPVKAGEDSQSFASILLDSKRDYDRLPLITHGNGGREYRYAITDGDWKLVMPNPKNEIELYDLSTDRAETKNIADQFPEKVAELTSRINRIIARGRTTNGPVQPNDTGWWEDLHWQTKQQYNKYQALEKIISREKG